MSFYDILDDMAKRESVKTQTGDQLIVGPMVGIVVKNNDPDSTVAGGPNSGEKAMDRRVCVMIPTRDENANELKWAWVTAPYAGPGWGINFLPEVGDQVLLLFEGGNIEKPYVIGSLPRVNDKFLKSCVDKDNQFKCIGTKHGSRIRFEDNSSDDQGKKDKLLLETAGQTLQILMDNENEKLHIGDKAKENVIDFSVKKDAGSITIQSKSKVTIQVGDKIKLSMNGETGAVSLQCESLSVQAKNNVKVKTEGSLKSEAPQVKFVASSSFSAEGGSGKFNFNTTSM